MLSRFGNDSLNNNFEFKNDPSPFCALLNQLLALLCRGQAFGCFTDFLICSIMTIVDKYASSWRQEIKSQKGSGLKRFRPSSDWQIEDNTAVTVMKLFSDLEESDNLGLDNLEILRDLLKGVKEWSLVDEVDKFVRQRKDFNTLLETIIPKLDELDNLDQLLSLCEDHVADDAKDDIKDVRSLVKELQKKNRLGVARLAVLRKILNETGQQELLDLLTEFEKKWEEEEKAERRKGTILRGQYTNTFTCYIVLQAIIRLVTRTLNVLHS